MPYAQRRPCTYPGCRELVSKGRCAQHRQDTDRPSAKQRGYDHRWARCRNAYVLQHPRCEIRHYCDGDPTEEVDHIVPIDEGGAILDESNLQATCKRCHSWKTRQDAKRRAEPMGVGKFHAPNH